MTCGPRPTAARSAEGTPPLDETRKKSPGSGGGNERWVERGCGREAGRNALGLYRCVPPSPPRPLDLSPIHKDRSARPVRSGAWLSGTAGGAHLQAAEQVRIPLAILAG